MKPPAARVAGFGPSPFAEMTALALRHRAVNLGQGFPDFGPPGFAVEAAEAALRSGLHQYSAPPGLPGLRTAVAEALAPALGFAPDPELEVTVTVGATEGMYVALQALLEPGDEAAVIEPAYDAYGPQVRLAGGVVRPVPLTLAGDRWVLEAERLAAAVSSRTKAILLNTPHNPTGKVFTRAELELMARLAQEHGAYVVSDEVYDRLTYAEEHLSIASLPGMRERTVTVGSFGKTFSATGWRVGWAVASPPVTAALRGAHQWISFAAPTPLQAAVAASLELAPGLGYYEALREEYRERRDFLAGSLEAAGLRPLVCEGGFFVVADYSGLSDAPDLEFCRHLVAEAGVAAIPPSIFYLDPPPGARLARFAFCKSQPVIEEAARRLERLDPERLRG